MVYMKCVIICGRNRCFAWMDNSVWEKKALVILDQPQSLITKSNVLKLDSLPWTLDLFFPCKRISKGIENWDTSPLSRISAHAYTIVTIGESPTVCILNCSSWFLASRQNYIPVLWLGFCVWFLNDIRNSEHETDVKISSARYFQT